MTIADRPSIGSVGTLTGPNVHVIEPSLRTARGPWRVAKKVKTVRGVPFAVLQESRVYLEQMGLTILSEDFGAHFYQVAPMPGWTLDPPGNLAAEQRFKDERGRIRFVQYVDLPKQVAYIDIV